MPADGRLRGLHEIAGLGGLRFRPAFGARAGEAFGGEQQPVQGVLPVGRFGCRHREPCGPAAGLQRPATAPASLRWRGCRCALCASCGCACPRTRPAPASVSPIAAARQGDPRDPFRATFQDHLPLRRTAGAHQQPGAIGCRLAQQFPEIILWIADIDHPRSRTGGGKRRCPVKAAQPAGALLVVDLRAGFHAVDGFAAAERRVQFKQTQRASGQGARKSGMGDNAGGSRARDSIQNAAARITESIGGNLMKAGQSMSAPSTYISEEIHSTVDRGDAVG